MKISKDDINSLEHHGAKSLFAIHVDLPKIDSNMWALSAVAKAEEILGKELYLVTVESMSTMNKAIVIAKVKGTT